MKSAADAYQKVESDAIPRVGAEQQEALNILWDLWEKNREEITSRLRAFAESHEEFAPLVKEAPREQSARSQSENARLQNRAMRYVEWVPLIRSLEEQGAAYAHQGIGFISTIALVGTVRCV